MSTGAVVRFSQSDYSAPEEKQQILVTVQTEGRHATPVTVRVTPLNYDDYLTLGIPLPEDFPFVPAFEEKHPNRAKSRQKNTFIHLSLICILLPKERAIYQDCKPIWLCDIVCVT